MGNVDAGHELSGNIVQGIDLKLGGRYRIDGREFILVFADEKEIENKIDVTRMGTGGDEKIGEYHSPKEVKLFLVLDQVYAQQIGKE